MYRKMAMDIPSWIAQSCRRPFAPILRSMARPFDLLRWFSIISFIVVFIISLAFAFILTHFLKQEILQRDAILTSQFVHSIAQAQIRQAHLDDRLALGQILDERVDLARFGVTDPTVVASARIQFYDHLRNLPDALLATVFSPDRKILWSTNPALIGTIDEGNDELDDAFAARIMVSTEYDAEEERKKSEQRFMHEPRKFFVEDYMPLMTQNGKVAAVVEIYKEPSDLERTIKRGNVLVWSCTVIGSVFIYVALFGIIRRADAILNEQKRRLVEAEALCLIGEMSAAVAHGIRNPLASIRSSAELALDGDLESTRKNSADIISQVDRLGRWVRDLLVFSRPVMGESQPIDLATLVDECLLNFATQLKNGRISVEFTRPAEPIPQVVGNRALANQALASIISNAIEAMPDGGSLRLELQPLAHHRRVHLIVTDTGTGMSPAQIELAFKPFYTTKRKGIGLGMALVKRIMERFDGSISLHSRVGVGTQAILAFNMV